MKDAVPPRPIPATVIARRKAIRKRAAPIKCPMCGLADCDCNANDEDFRSYTAIGGFINPNRDEERDANDRRAARDDELERRVHE